MTAMAQTGKIFVDGTFETIEDADHHLQQLHYISGGDGLFATYIIDQHSEGIHI
ncbi:MAG: hypothetical protein Q8O72_02805 [Bacteroidales bacterium]|nr:hypothetical protein [Bacteroidales bacterium]